MAADFTGVFGTGIVVERELGGGMSRVLLARDTALSRRIVIKLLPPELAAGVSTDRFRREILLVARLQHPHIVPLLNAGELPDGTVFYTMPFVEGESLRARLERGQVAIDQALRWMRDIASALAHAHAQGVVHRDMKPDNVLLSEGYAVVADFGIAKALSSATAHNESSHTLTSVGVTLGTPAYMAPEQVGGDADVDHRADLYALGVIGYEMLAGRLPFEGRSARALMVAHVMTPPEPLSDHRSGIPAALEALIMQCLEKEPSERPASAVEVVESLERIVRDPVAGSSSETGARSMAAPAAQSIPASSMAPRRNVRVAVAASAVLGAAALAAAALFWRDQPPIAGRVAVATFRTAGDASLSEMARTIAQDISTDVGALDSTGVVGREEVERAEARVGGDARPTELASKLRAQYVVTGAIAALGADSVRVRAGIVAGGNGETIRELEEVHASRANASGALEAMRARLAGGLLMLTSPMFGRATLPVRDPPTFNAMRDLIEGLELEASLRSPDPSEDEVYAELTRFDRAVVADPEFLQARLWFASAALRRFGGEALADSALVLVEAQQERLTTYERSLLEALRADAAGNHELSVRAWRRVRALAPSWPASWWLAMKLRDANRPREAKILIDSLALLNSHFARSMPSLDHYLGDYTAEGRALAAEATRSPGTVQSLGFQEARLQSLIALDSIAVVNRRLDDVGTLPAESGTSVAHLLSRTAWELSAHGRVAEGDSALARAVAWCRARTPIDLHNSSIVADCIEVYSLAARPTELAALAATPIREHADDIVILGHLGLAAALAGDRSVANTFATRIERSVRVDGSRGLAWWLRGRIAGALGDSATAVALLRESFARGASWSQRIDLHRDPAFAKLRGYEPFEQLRRPQG
jgi:tRNA A-37 threonylcarbamoyl transferase component Bud32/TolB-like protein